MPDEVVAGVLADADAWLVTPDTEAVEGRWRMDQRMSAGSWLQDSPVAAAKLAPHLELMAWPTDESATDALAATACR